MSPFKPGDRVEDVAEPHTQGTVCRMPASMSEMLAHWQWRFDGDAGGNTF
jgi:hypothetical protein